MERTQVYLSVDDLGLLDKASADTGASRSELIRRAIRSQYRRRDVEQMIADLGSSAGSWKDRDFTGEEYVASIRTNSAERRRRLGLD